MKNHSFKYFKILVVFILLLNRLSVCKNSFNHFYISNTKNDLSIGTIQKPFYNINQAIKKLTAGDTLTILGGEYNITDEIIVSQKGSDNAWIIIEGDSTQPTIINAKDVNVKWDKQY